MGAKHGKLIVELFGTDNHGFTCVEDALPEMTGDPETGARMTLLVGTTAVSVLTDISVIGKYQLVAIVNAGNEDVVFTNGDGEAGTVEQMSIPPQVPFWSSTMNIDTPFTLAADAGIQPVEILLFGAGVTP
jgi:hypothetical protein